MKYANIAFEKKIQVEGNIGDYFQLLAIDTLYQKMGLLEDEIQRIEYFNLLDYVGEDIILPINFFLFNPSQDKPFILPPAIHPVYLGLHLPGSLTEEEAQYLKTYTPLGCRDEKTLEQVENKVGGGICRAV